MANEASFSSVAGGADPGRGAERLFLAGNRLRRSGFGANVSKDVARRPSVKTGATVPGYSGGLAAGSMVRISGPRVVARAPRERRRLVGLS
jgi:hypothetical protein